MNAENEDDLLHRLATNVKTEIWLNGTQLLLLRASMLEACRFYEYFMVPSTIFIMIHHDLSHKMIFTGSNLLRSRFWGFSTRRGDMLHRWGEIWRGGGDHAKFHPHRCNAKFHPHRCNDKGVVPQNWNMYSDLTEMWNINAPQRRFSQKFAEFVPHFRMR